MNQFKALGVLLLLIGIIIFLFFYNPTAMGEGPIAIFVNLWVPITCVFAGLGLLIKGFMWKPPQKKRSSSSRGKKKKNSKGSRKKKK